MVQSLDRSQGRAGGVAAGAGDTHATFTGNRALQIEEPLIFEMGQPGRCGVDLPEPPKVEGPPRTACAAPATIGLPGLSEPQVVQHYTRLSQKNYAIDMGVYPAGLVHHEAQSRASTRRWRACPASATSIRCSRSRPCRARWS